MPKHPEITPLHLRKRLNQIVAEMEARSPDLAAEARRIRMILAAEESSPGHPYASCRTPWDAIELCLNLSGDYVLTKREMVDAIVGGGYLGPKPKAAHALINTSINYHTGKGNLLEKYGLVGRPKR